MVVWAQLKSYTFLPFPPAGNVFESLPVGDGLNSSLPRVLNMFLIKSERFGQRK